MYQQNAVGHSVEMCPDVPVGPEVLGMSSLGPVSCIGAGRQKAHVTEIYAPWISGGPLGIIRLPYC